MRDEAKKDETPGWLLTYGDMVTLLVTFFVMLISLSSINVDKYKEVMTQVQAGAMGEYILEGGKKPVELMYENEMELMKSTPRNERFEGEDLISDEEIYQYLSNYIDETQLSKYLRIEETKIGYKIKIPTDECFAKGEYLLKRKARTMLRKLSAVLNIFTGRIIVDTNVNTPLMALMELSGGTDLYLYRAADICKCLEKEGNVNPERIALAGQRMLDEFEDTVGFIVLKRMNE